jgi:hypothetical protein
MLDPISVQLPKACQGIHVNVKPVFFIQAVDVLQKVKY